MGNITKRITVLSLVLFSFTSCEVVEGIFKAGMGFGIFIVILIIAIVIWVFAKLFRK